MTPGTGRAAGRRLYKNPPSRLQWRKKHTGEANGVVKGMNRRVVVVRSPDPRIFDEAIFIVKDEFLRSDPDGAQKLLEEARRAADDYVRRSGGERRRPFRRKWTPLYAAAGAAAAGAAWLAVRFVGVLF